MTPAQMYEAVVKVARPGDVINFDSRGKTFYMRWIFRQIRKVQKKMFCKETTFAHRFRSMWNLDSDCKYKDIHSALALFSYDNVPMLLSATVPVVVIEPLKISKRTKSITVCRLRGSGEGFSAEWIRTMRKAANELVGGRYDFLDMLAIKLRLQGWRRNFLGKWIVKALDFGKKRVVCSGAAQYCLLEAWEGALPQKNPFSLDGLEPNRATPAHFRNDPTFETVLTVEASC